MPVLDSHVFDMTRAIQLAVAPVFLLTAIGAIINALMGRLGRAVDRRRKLEELLPAFEGETLASMERELGSLARRIKLVFWAMAFAVLSALLVCLLIGTAFIGTMIAVLVSTLLPAGEWSSPLVSSYLHGEHIAFLVLAVVVGVIAGWGSLTLTDSRATEEH